MFDVPGVFVGVAEKDEAVFWEMLKERIPNDGFVFEAVLQPVRDDASICR